MFNNVYEKVKRYMKENLLSIVLIVLLFVLLYGKVPYEVEMPGGTINLDSRVMVNGEEQKYSGSFNMAYVSIVEGSIPYTLLGLLMPDWDVIKVSDVTLENETIKDSQERDKIYLEQSKNNAMIAGMKAAGVPYTLDNVHHQVIYITEDAETDLQIGDYVLACDGVEISDVEQIRKTINSKNEGDTIFFRVLRDEKEKQVKAKIYSEKNELYAGISVVTTYDIESDTKIEINSKASESGPSGGFMMALMVYSSLTHQDLTKGRTIVGTGTISVDGKVGEIGGVKYKIMGAEKAGADIFFVPKANYEEAIKVKNEKKYNIDIVSVETLQDGISYLEGLNG